MGPQFFSYILYVTLIIILGQDSMIKAQRTPRTTLVSFKPIGRDVAVGLDFELPFVRVPLKKYKDKYGSDVAMVNINSASLVVSGLIAGGCMVVAHLLRTLGILRPQSKEGKDEAEEKSGRGARGEETNMNSVFEYFKLIYKNDTGERVETSLPHLFARIEETFLENDIDLGICLQKSLCSLVFNATENVRLGRANSVQKILDGLSSYDWLLEALVPYRELLEAVRVGKKGISTMCKKHYPGCKWNVPEEQLAELLGAYVRFQ